MNQESKGLKPEDLKKGMKVVYTPKNQEGEVSSWNDHYVFVRYEVGGTAQATNYEDLEKIW